MTKLNRTVILVCKILAKFTWCAPVGRVTPLLSVSVVLVSAMPSCALSARSGFTKCSGITGRLVANPNYVCPRCKGKAWPINGNKITKIDVDDPSLDVGATFCYLDDMLCSGGVYDSAIATKCCAAWGKFRRLLPILTTKHLSPKVRGKV